ncbi:MAG: hypothetical protein AB1728_11750 [Bacteroidota bacterium]
MLTKQIEDKILADFDAQLKKKDADLQTALEAKDDEWKRLQCNRFISDLLRIYITKIPMVSHSAMTALLPSESSINVCSGGGI